MKRVITIVLTALFSNLIVAQGALDALRFSQLRYEGTARSMALGNAFTSLGGDTYSMSINPASSAIFRYSEFVFTPSLLNESVKTQYLNNKENENWLKPGISNVGFVGKIKVGSTGYGLKSISFGIAVNKLNNYNSRSYSSGVNAQSSWLGSLADGLGGVFNGNLNINDSWNPFYDFPGASWREILAWNSNLLDPLPDSDYDYIGATENIRNMQIVMGGPLNQQFYREKSGSLSEIVFNTGANISDRFFIGANISLQSISFSDFQKYSEIAQTPGSFDSKFSSFTHTYRQNSEGAGINFKVGFIALPVAGLRLGGSISTPTWHFIKDEWDETIDARYSDGYKSSILSPVGEYSYRVNSPFRWNLGAAYIFGKVGLVSVDYEGVDYSTITMLTEDGDKFGFRDANSYISSNFQAAHILRAGVEIKPLPAIALRAGYTLYSNPEKSFGNDLTYISGGIGVSGKKGSFIDVGFRKRLSNSESFTLYDDYTNHSAPVGSIEASAWNLLVTLGFRF
jgi:hypothetical protein